MTVARGRGMLGRAVRADDRDPERRHALGHRGRHRRPPQADPAHELQVGGGAVGVVEQAGEEVGGAAARGQVVLEHAGQYGAGVPHVDEADGLALPHREQQPAQHADGVPHRRPHEEGRVAALHGSELSDLEADGAVRVHHALGIGGGPRGVGHQRRGGGVDGDRRGQRVAFGQCVEGGGPRRYRPVADHAHHLQGGRLGADVLEGGQIVLTPEALRRDQGPHPGAPQDVGDLLGPVEMDDGGHHGAEVGGGPEAHGGLGPVGKLEGHHVAGADAPGRQPARQPAGPGEQLPEGALGGADGGADGDGEPGPRLDGADQHLPHRVVAPVAGVDVAALDTEGGTARMPQSALAAELIVFRPGRCDAPPRSH